MAVGGGELTPDLICSIVCEKMHWTYDQFLEQPDWFVNMLLMRWQEEGKDQERRRKEV